MNNLGILVGPKSYLCTFFVVYVRCEGWGPHAYFQMLQESQNNGPSSSNTENALTVQQSQLESICIQPQHGMDGLEFGRRN